MGGQNHQPCGSYLELSTKLSRTVSEARSYLELANIAFEEVILTELRGDKKSVALVIENLQESAGKIGQAKNLIAALSEQMYELGYQDLPPLHKLDLDSIGATMAQLGMTDLRAWEATLEVERRSGFYGVLDLFRRKLVSLQKKTDSLILLFQNLDQPEFAGHIAEIMEKNQPGNVKIEFAQLYTGWQEFQSIFLASSMLSTEIWYAFTNAPSLVIKEAALKAG
jgi:hypothetical protein